MSAPFAVQICTSTVGTKQVLTDMSWCVVALDREEARKAHHRSQGHEFAGEIVKIGAAVKNFKLGDRVVSPFTTSCGSCFFCLRQLTCRCIESQLFGSKTLEGAQAEFVRVPLAGALAVFQTFERRKPADRP